ncbi:MAG: zinc-binding dehydrogenase [Deinococcota bacterium]
MTTASLPQTTWQSIRVAPKTSRLEQRPLPQLGANDVLIRVRVCGVCASEVYPWVHAPDPKAFGHEVVGEVVAVGSEVVGFEPPMRVTGLVFNGFAEYTVAPATHLTPVPESLSDEAALGEPLSCVISGMRNTGIELGDQIALVGAGFMGLLTLQAANLKGPGEVIAIDNRPEALERALTYGATQLLAPADVAAPLCLDAWEDVPLGYGLNVVIEAAGNPHALALAGRMVQAHGILAIVGFHQGEPVPIDMEMWNWKAIRVVNAHERRHDYQMDCMARGLRLVEVGKLQLASLITHSFSLEEVDAAFNTLLNKPADFIKAIIKVSD